jgi:nitrogen fixation NifU-like protein
VDAPELIDTNLLGYSPTAVEHYRCPRNVGRLQGANAVGVVDDQATENLITIYLRIEADRVVAASFRTLGCSACIAASSVVTELATSRSRDELRAVDGAAVLAALDGLPSGKEQCARLAAEALQLALDGYAQPA